MIAFKVMCCDLKIGFCAVNKTEKNTHHTVARQKVKMLRNDWCSGTGGPLHCVQHYYCSHAVFGSRLLCICDAFLITGEVKWS